MFTLKPEEVNFDKIKSFCEEKIPEGETIEYKRAFPPDSADLAKSISAMANRYGGIILIGVKANKTTNTPILPIQGIDLTEGLEEKVTSICLKNIHRPYIPKAKVCNFQNKRGEDKAVVFIRVEESHETPHAINNNTDVYLRIGSQNQPFRKATVDEIEQLKNRRQKAVENREALMQRADQRFLSMPFDPVDRIHIATAKKDLHSSYRKVSIVPLFPNKPLFEYSELSKLKDTFHNPGDQVFCLDEPISSSGSLCFPYVVKSNSLVPDWFNYSEFNIYGLVYNKQGLWENADPETRELFDVSYFLKQIYRVVTVGKAIYEKTGFFGSTLIVVQVGEILGRSVGLIDIRPKRMREKWCDNKIEPNIRITKICSFAELHENLDTLLLEICKEFLWCCGAGTRIKEFEDHLRSLVEQAKKLFSKE
ncbi:MAG: hypothetical protein AMJ73_01415 [candidate division Zixibacteria bacterium SM1_73]|nr:MAG: hypothetical protein AMJ73_01415 [candidate division Zixibacteria bacterium SM1_73]